MKTMTMTMSNDIVVCVIAELNRLFLPLWLDNMNDIVVYMKYMPNIMTVIWNSNDPIPTQSYK